MKSSRKFKEVGNEALTVLDDEPLPKKIHINYKKLVVPSRMRSAYWKYFGFPAGDDGNMLTKDVIVCILCKNQMVYNRNTSNLKMHLGSRHRSALLAVESEEGSEDPKTSKQRKIHLGAVDSPNIEIIKSLTDTASDLKTDMIVSEDIYDNEVSDIAIIFPTNEEMPQYEQSKAESESNDIVEINEVVMNFLIADLVSPKIVEGKGFQNFVAILTNGRFSVPNEKKIIEEIIPNLYKTYKDFVYSEIVSSSTSNISLSIEQWTCAEDSPCLSVYVHYLLNEEPVLHSKLLTSVCFSGYETTEQWSEFLDSLFNEWSINSNSISAVLVAFHNEELREALKSKNIILLPCFLFLMQNFCSEYCFKHETVDEILRKCRSLIRHVQENKVDLKEDDDEFVDEDGDENDFTFSCDQPDIWLTTYYMLRGVMRRRRAIIEFLDMKSFENPFSAGDWKNIKNILELLEPLKTVVLTLFEEKNSLISLLRPLIWKVSSCKFNIKTEDSALIKELKNDIVNVLNDAYSGNDIDDFSQIATKLDPRFKTFVQDETTDVESHLVNLLTMLVDEHGLSFKSLNGDKKTTKKQNRLSGINVLFGSFRVGKEEQSNEDAVKMEISAYRSESNALLEECPLEWWQGMRKKCPNLIKLARKYHCVPAVILMGNLLQLKDYIAFCNKRASLPLQIADSFLFLHINK